MLARKGNSSMPLYDFLCEDCGKPSTLLMKASAEASCPHCSSMRMLKQFAPFAVTSAAGADGGAAAHTPRKASGGGHVHTAACAGGGCGARADALIKKYLD
jgi:putative FmdB family regulatory protein